MNRVIITIIAIIVIISAMLTAFAIFAPNKKETAQQEKTEIAEEEILDDCTDEYEMMTQKTEVTNSEEEKTSPNCSLEIKTYFKDCQHITRQYSNLPEDLVNLTKEEIQKKYPDYMIQSFSSNEIVLYKQSEGSCGEHYLVKSENGVVSIYKVLENGNLEKIENTEISTEYLPETDRMNMEKGIEVNGKQSLNQLLEDFE